MLDYIDLDVSDIKKAKMFYLAVLKPVGYEIFMEWGKWVGFAVGGKDNGAPGIRKIYHPNYYSAFIFDPDRHNIEVVCQEAE